MNIKDLNEQFGKFLMNEISDETVNSFDYERDKNLKKATINFASGKGSLASLKKAKEKNDKAQDLIAKRKARKEANYKHTLKVVSFDDVEFIDNLYGLSDEDLIRVANAIDNGNVVTSIESAKEKIQSKQDEEGSFGAVIDISYDDNTLLFGPSDTMGANDFYVYFDMTPDEVKAGKAKEKAKEEKKRKKAFKALEPANLAKEVKKSGKVCDASAEDADNVVEYWFHYELKNNTGLSSQEELNKYLNEYIEDDDYDFQNMRDYFSYLLDYLNAGNVVPEVKDIDGELYIDVENADDLWIELINKNTLAIHGIIAVLEV